MEVLFTSRFEARASQVSPALRPEVQGPVCLFLPDAFFGARLY